MTSSFSVRTSSCMKTVSAPLGIGAPVKILIASPAAGDMSADFPAVTRPAMRSLASDPRRKVGMPHGIAVDRGIIEWRQIDRRGDIARNHPAGGLRERDGFGFRQRLHALRDDPLEIFDRQQRPGKREAIVGQLRHQFTVAGISRRSIGNRFGEKDVGDLVRCR